MHPTVVVKSFLKLVYHYFVSEVENHQSRCVDAEERVAVTLDDALGSFYGETFSHVQILDGLCQVALRQCHAHTHAHLLGWVAPPPDSSDIQGEARRGAHGRNATLN